MNVDSPNYLSCDPERIYDAGGFYEDSSILDALKQRTNRNAQFISELFPAYSYSRAMPHKIVAVKEFQEKLIEHYRRINSTYSTGAACVLTELSDAVLAENLLYPSGNGSRSIIYETHRPPDRADSPILDGNSEVETYPTEPDSLYLFVGSVGSFNFGHWLIDDAARVYAFHKLRALYPKRRIVILIPSYCMTADRSLPDYWDTMRTQAIRRLIGRARNYDIVPVDHTRAYRFSTLFYATPVSYHPFLKSPEALTFVSRRLRKPWWRIALRPGPKRILVLRREARGRVLRNMESVRALLKRQGFQSIDPEAMSMARQASTFARAEIVVGIMGATMTNTLFCKPGTHIVYLAPEGWNEPFYWDLAALRSHIYTACYGPIIPTPGPAHMTAFEIPESALMEALASSNLPKGR